MNASLGTTLQDLADAEYINGLLSTKYLAAAGLTCALYDHVLTFNDEFKYFWTRGYWDASRVIFFLTRYFNEAAMLYAAYVFAGLRPDMTDTECRSFLMSEGALGMLTIGIANVFMVLRHYTLWDRRKGALYALWAAFALSYTTVVVLFFFTLISLYSHIYYNQLLHTCLISHKPQTIIGVWAAMSAFDVFTIVLALSNALDQPYSETVEVLTRFRRDGAIFFVSLLCLRFLNLVCSIVLPKEELFLNLFFVWAMVSITTCRLMLRVESIRGRAMTKPANVFQMNELDTWRSRQ